MLASGIFFATLLFVIWQPRGLGIGWSAMAGAAVALAMGVIHIGDVPVVWRIVWDATFTFVGLIIISLLLDEAGFFEWSALHVARFGGGKGRLLFGLVVLLGGGIASLFANDGAALLLTPIVVAILSRLEFTPVQTMAFVIATGFVADTTSLPLIISNLVNIVSANYFGINFDHYAIVMLPVDVVALVATLGVVLWYFWAAVPVGYDVVKLGSPASVIRSKIVFFAAFPVLGLLLAAYFMLAPLGVPVSSVTCGGAVVLLGLAVRERKIPVVKVLREAPWQIVIFSLGMYLVVYGLRNAGLTIYLARGLVWVGGQGDIAATIGTGFGAAILSSVMNNMPAVLIGALAIEQSHNIAPRIRDLMIYANIIGCDLGPKFTPIGSLATLLWLNVLGRKGINISWGQYMKLGLVMTPPVLLVVLVGLAVWLPVISP